MASTNVHKIMRSNIKLKPWLLTKNSHDVVNSCIQKIYKFAPKSAAAEPKKVEPRPENVAPLRCLKTRERAGMPPSAAAKAALTAAGRPKRPIVSNLHLSEAPPPPKPLAPLPMESRAKATAAMPAKAASTPRRSALHTPSMMSGTLDALMCKRSALATLASRKARRSPNFKIYGSRRRASSDGSSSTSSLFRRPEDRQRPHRSQQPLAPTHNFLARSYGTHQAKKLSPFDLNNTIAKYVTAVRNQHMNSTRRAAGEYPPASAAEEAAPRASAPPGGAVDPLAQEVTEALRRDLMVIDGSIKDRIAVGHKRSLKAHLRDCRAARHEADPMKGWHHPPAPELVHVYADEREMAAAELASQQRALAITQHLQKLTLNSLLENAQRSQAQANRQRSGAGGGGGEQRERSEAKPKMGGGAGGSSRKPMPKQKRELEDPPMPSTATASALPAAYAAPPPLQNDVGRAVEYQTNWMRQLKTFQTSCLPPDVAQREPLSKSNLRPQKLSPIKMLRSLTSRKLETPRMDNNRYAEGAGGGGSYSAAEGGTADEQPPSPRDGQAGATATSILAAAVSAQSGGRFNRSNYTKRY